MSICPLTVRKALNRYGTYPLIETQPYQVLDEYFFPNTALPRKSSSYAAIIEDAVQRETGHRNDVFEKFGETIKGK
jgi:hypothetical protein